MANQKILIADDESRLRKLVRDYLTRENYDVIEAADGEEALEYALSGDYDGIILETSCCPKKAAWRCCTSSGAAAAARLYCC